MDRARSLQIEHVSPAGLMRRGISRSHGLAGGNEASILALMRRWFFARKPDAGFVLTDFPATLLQAKVFDEWLDARDEEIDAVVAGSGAPGQSWDTTAHSASFRRRPSPSNDPRQGQGGDRQDARGVRHGRHGA